MTRPLVPHRGMSAWARPLDNNEGTETKRRIRRATDPSPCPLGGMQPRPGTPSYEDTTIVELGTGWYSTLRHGGTKEERAPRPAPPKNIRNAKEDSEAGRQTPFGTSARARPPDHNQGVTPIAP